VVVLKKGEMGVGTLIIFIAMLLVAAVAAGVLIQTVSSLQEKSLATGQQAESQISTHSETIEVSATDGRNGNLTDFQQIIKLSPGSEPIKLSQVIFTFNTRDRTGTLKYKGEASVCEKSNRNGYNTWNIEIIDTAVNGAINGYALEEDYDDDKAVDYVYTNGTTLVFNFSTAGAIAVALGGNISDIGPGGLAINVDNARISNGSTIFGYVTVSGTSNTNSTIEADMTFTVTPFSLGEGYFSAIYEQRSTNWIDGTLQRGDIVRLCYEAPRAVNEDEEIRLNFIPKIGTSTLTQFSTPEVISTERVYLYP
jgi:flagellin-like protein